jgi:hypothetical protein
MFRGHWSFLTVIVFVAACSWEVSPSLTRERLTEDPDPCRAGAGTHGQPDCGVQFSARTWGECKDCNDRGCSKANEGTHVCTCYSKRRDCIGAAGDAGVSLEMPQLCQYNSTQCECDDSLGRIYDCQCEGGGDNCDCQPPRDVAFDFGLECEH